MRLRLRPPIAQWDATSVQTLEGVDGLAVAGVAENTVVKRWHGSSESARWLLRASNNAVVIKTITGRPGVFIPSGSVLGLQNDTTPSLIGKTIFVVITIHIYPKRTEYRTLLGQRGSVMFQLRGSIMYLAVRSETGAWIETSYGESVTIPVDSPSVWCFQYSMGNNGTLLGPWCAQPHKTVGVETNSESKQRNGRCNPEPGCWIVDGQHKRDDSRWFTGKKHGKRGFVPISPLHRA